MYITLLTLHSLLRWIVLALLLFAVYIAATGYFKKRVFSGTDNAVRHWTATAAHIQLLIGMILYFKSPVVKAWWKIKGSLLPFDYKFFSLLHLVLMFAAIVVLTVGSAKTKREMTDQKKFSTMLIWFVVALLLILIAIPWPFSPLVKRPYIRMF
jgi:drug/metabolite transporter (DMT)-like permease